MYLVYITYTSGIGYYRNKKKIAKSLSITENQVNIEDIKKVEVNGINLIHAYVKTNEGTGICVLGFHKNILISEAACLGHIKKEYVKNNN